MDETRQLKDAGLKVTTPRLKVLQILDNNKEKHLSAEDVYKALLESGEDIGLATVYRVLSQFELAGIIERHNFEGNYSVFELNQGEHHDHLVCVQCGKVEEFCDPVIEKRQEVIASDAGFKMKDHSLTIYGHCTDCN